MMFRFYLNSEYRRVYGELSRMQLLSETMVLRFSDYLQYFRHLVIIDPGISRQIQVLSREKMSALKVMKALLLLHAWLQSTCVIEEPEQVIGFINGLFEQVEELAGRLKANQNSIKSKLSRSAVFREEGERGEQLQASKEVFILQEVAKPYLYYLQKLVSIFDFYNSLKKNFIRPMNPSEVWVVINLFRCIIKVTNHIKSICKFVRRSYRPLAQALAQAFSQDVINFYPKLYKYCYGEVGRMRSVFFQAQGEVGEQQAFLRCAEGVEGMVALLQEVLQVNHGMCMFLDEPLLQDLDFLYLPKLIDVGGSEFQLVFHLHKLKKNGYPHVIGSFATPKFFISQGSQQTEGDECNEEIKQKEQGKVGVGIFEDISNGQDLTMTFRRQKQGRIGRMKRRASQESMGEN